MDATAPDAPEVRAFLRRTRVALVATRSPGGRPFMTPLWFVLDGDALVIGTGAESRTARNVSRHPEVTLLLTGGASGRAERVLRLRGTASLERGMLPWRALRRVAAKYFLTPRALALELRNVARWRLRSRYYRKARGGPGYLRIVPTHAEFLPDARAKT